MGKAMRRTPRPGLREGWARFIMRLPLRRAFVVYVLLYMLLAIALVLGTCLAAGKIRDRILLDAMIDMQITDMEDVVRINRATINASVELRDGKIVSHRVILSQGQEPLYAYCGYAQMLSIVVWPLLCLWLAARRFYRRKLREPLALLQHAAARIGQNDLDFSLHYDTEDELGRLCADFEQMRAGVLAHEREMWRTLETHRRQTAALAHDLRTPLTVLKGQMELLDASAEAVTPERLHRAMHTMRSHILRMERYVAGLGEMRRTQEEGVHMRPVPLEDLARTLEETGLFLCREKALAFSMETVQAPVTVPADTQLIQRVFDNLLSNALRYAGSRIQASLLLHSRRLTLTVRDDGPGFSPEALARASEPFFSESKTGADGHLGLGLHIAQVLCERCGGSLMLSNARTGGAVIVADFGFASHETVEKS